MPATKLLSTSTAFALLSLSLLWVLAPRPARRARTGGGPEGGGLPRGAVPAAVPATASALQQPEVPPQATMSDGPNVAGEAGTGGRGPQALEALQAAEVPAAGFPSDRSHDADTIRPGLADYARGA